MSSRQRMWQIKKQAAGLCVICGKKRNHGTLRCDEHQKIEALARKKKWRDKHPGAKRYNSKYAEGGAV